MIDKHDLFGKNEDKLNQKLASFRNINDNLKKYY